MRFLIITHVLHTAKDNKLYGYSPYVREMNLWLKQVDEVKVLAPFSSIQPTSIDLAYQHSAITFIPVEQISLTSISEIVKTLWHAPKIVWKIFKAMKQADHIHLRCPGNIGLLGCLVQICFPKKMKTAKYAGNWDPKSKQPLSYRFQKWILSNAFLTKNMQVLVYGDWENSSKNIKPFFTATYSESEKLSLEKQNWNQKIRFIFAGTLSEGKNPMYAVRLAEQLQIMGIDVGLDLYGEGTERHKLEKYIAEKKLENCVNLKGNQDKETLKKAYQNSHFIILPSKSEGWPKVVAEGMFWGCIPVATSVSCVSNMLENGNRGILLKMNLDQDVLQIANLLKNESELEQKRKDAAHWSRQFTLEVFEEEIGELVVRSD